MLDLLRKRPDRWVMGVAVVFASVTLLLVINRYYSFYSTYDQGIFNQVYWNSSHGRFFQSSLSSQLSTNVVHGGEIPDVAYHRLGQHFTPALMIWLPLYWLFPSPLTLSVLQVGLVTAAGLVLYRLGRCHLEPGPAAAIATSFYGANAIIGPTIGNFHDSCQIPLFVFLLLLGLERRWWWLYGAMAIVIPLVREDSGVILFSLGAYLLVSRRHPWLGLGLCSYSLTYMLVLTNWGMPQFSSDVSKRFMLERFGQYTQNDEASTLEIIAGMASQPLLLLKELVTPVNKTVRYLLGQWLPFALIPAIAPEAWLAAGFPLLKLLIAKGESVLAINIRYAMTIVPGLAYGTILWWSNHPNLFNSLRMRRFWTICVSLSLFFTLTSNPNRTLSFLIPDAINPTVYVTLPQQWRHAAHVRRIVQQVPPEASVSAMTQLVPQLSNRRELVRFPYALQVRNDAGEVISVDYAVEDLWQLQRYAIAFGTDRDLLRTAVEWTDRMLADGSYGLIAAEDGVLLMQAKATSIPSALAHWQAIRAGINADFIEKA